MCIIRTEENNHQLDKPLDSKLMSCQSLPNVTAVDIHYLIPYHCLQLMSCQLSGDKQLETHLSEQALDDD